MGMYPSLMRTFSCPTTVLMIGSSFSGDLSLLNSLYFRTTHMEYPWILPSLSPSNGLVEMDVPFPVAMIAYQAHLECVVEPSHSSL